MQWLLDRGRIPFLLIVGGISLFLGYHCLHLEIDRDNRSMDADDEVQKALEAEFRNTFQESDSILLAVHRENLLDESGRRLLEKLVERLASLEGVREIVSPVEFDFEVPEGQKGILVSEDGTMAGIRVLIQTFADDGQKLSNLLDEVSMIVEEQSTGRVRIALTGLPVQKNEVGILVRRDQQLFAPLSLLVLGLVLLFVTKRGSGMLFPLLVSAITICWTLGIYSLFGQSLNMITSLLPPVIMTLSVATTIHIYLDWLHEPETDNRKRIINAVRNLYRPCLFASLTTAIGFLSLLLSETPAVRLFGMFAALGVGISYFLGVVGIAVGLSFLKPPRTEPDVSPRHAEKAHRCLDAIAGLTVNYPIPLILAAVVIGVIGVMGAKRIETDTDLLNFLGEEHPLVQDTRFIDEHLAGTSVIELFLKGKDEAPLESIAKLAELEDAFRELEGVRHIMGVPDLLPPPALRLLDQGISLADIVSEIDLTSYLNSDRTKIRITIFTESIGTREGSELVSAIRNMSEEQVGDTFEVGLIGGFYRVIVESNQLVEAQLKSFFVAIVLILVAIGVVFRSVTYSLLSIIPNVVPLLLTAAVMGFSGIALSTGTAMIASVVIGIAVDDTIHYMSAYRRAGHGGRIAAIKKTTRSTGFVLLSTTMALSAGFWVAIFGSFQPTVFFALLTGVTMWFALACDLLVLPAFLRLAGPGPVGKEK